MAVVPTGEIFKTLTFDGQSSGDYGVYITGEAVYNAPARDVEMVTIPGRNGQLALDKGRFENIEVSYPAGIFADNETDFAQAVSDFRNFLASRSGYCRLEDDYNPNEYRMAVYKSGLEVDPKLLRAGEFDITFNCKPQRWLKDGEVAVECGQDPSVLFNPTLFESSPLLRIWGYGTVGVNGYEIELENEVLGEITLQGSASWSTSPKTFTLDLAGLNESDLITVRSLKAFDPRAYVTDNVSSFTISTTTSNASAVVNTGEKTLYVTVTANDFSFPANVSFEFTASATVQLALSLQGGGSATAQIMYRTKTEYNATSKTITITGGVTVLEGSSYIDFKDTVFSERQLNSIVGQSTKSLLGNPTYIDCDLGEAYMYEGTTVIDLNRYIDLGSNLPTLAPGNNEITYDDTVTQLDITPRWWKI